MSEIIFEVREGEVGGGFTASALGLGIHSEGGTLEDVVSAGVTEFREDRFVNPREVAHAGA